MQISLGWLHLSAFLVFSPSTRHVGLDHAREYSFIKTDVTPAVELALPERLQCFALDVYVARLAWSTLSVSGRRLAHIQLWLEAHREAFH
jgi:hypothetical protein